ncbi:MAG: hypothetical protein IPF97_04900 [Sphingomonadales bacterium]|nr:hypothetical protein [Sphingomonadales bacterium]
METLAKGSDRSRLPLPTGLSVTSARAVQKGPTSVDQPFFVEIDRDNPVHILDTDNLEIALNELDTIFDFTAYLNAKIEAIERHKFLTYWIVPRRMV